MVVRLTAVCLLLALVMVQGCALRSTNVAPEQLNTLVVLSERAQQHVEELGEAHRLPTGSYEQFLQSDGSPNIAAIAAANPDLIYLPEQLSEYQQALTEYAPVALVSQFGQQKYSPLQQEYAALAALTQRTPEAQRTWQKLKKPLKQIRAQLAYYPNILLLFQDGDALYVHNNSDVGQILIHDFQADIADKHLSPERKMVDASYLRLVQPQTILLVTHGAQAALPELANEQGQVFVLPAVPWAHSPLTTGQLPALSQQLLELLQP